MASEHRLDQQRAYQDVIDAFDQAPAAVALYEGAELRLRFSNVQYEVLVGRPLPLGESLWQLMPELRDSEVPELMAQVLQRGETVVRHNAWFTLESRPEGQRRVVMNVSYAPWRGAGQVIRGVLVTAVDISAQALAVAQATAGDARLRAMADALPHGIFICNPAGKMHYVNERWKQLTGYTEHTFSAAAWAHMIHAEDLPLVASCWRSSTLEDGVFDVYARIRHRNAVNYRWQRLLGRCFSEGDTSELTWVCSWTDVHERMVHDLAREAAHKAFVASLVHDLRAPLAGIRASVENMQRKQEAAQLFRSKFERIVQATERADSMLQTLLDIDRMTGEGAEPLAFEPHNLTDLMAEPLANYTAAHGERMVAHLPSALHGFWHGPSLMRAVDNLLGNAFKYGDGQGFVTLTLRQADDMCCIVVHNTGHPIDPKDQARIFVPYERNHRGTIQGWGLGLSMVVGVARAHKGSIRVESTQAQGTTFILKVPRDPRRPSSAPREHAVGSAAPHGSGSWDTEAMLARHGRPAPEAHGPQA